MDQCCNSRTTGQGVTTFLNKKSSRSLQGKTFTYLFHTHSHDISPRRVRDFWHHMKKIFLHHHLDDFKQLKFKNFQDALTSNSKTFETQFGFQVLSRAWKKGNFFKKFQEQYHHHHHREHAPEWIVVAFTRCFQNPQSLSSVCGMSE